MLVAGGGGGAANSMIIFHAESVKVPVNCTLTSASELEAALPKELLPISALGKRIHHCRPQETAKSFPELLAAKSPCYPPRPFFLFFPFFPSFGRGSEGGCWIVSAPCGSGKNGSLWRVARGVPGLVSPHRPGSAGPLPWHCGACARRCAQGLGGGMTPGGSALSLAAGPLQPLVSSCG